MDTVILPAVAYGPETWAVTKYQEKKLAVGQPSMGRFVVKHHEERQDSE